MSTNTETNTALARCIEANPDLSAYGWRFRDRRNWNNGEAFAANRDQMHTEDFAQQVECALTYLRTHRIPKGAGSYGMKHRAENASGQYVSNGAFIVAAILTGYQIQRDDNSPNCGFKTPAGGSFNG